MILKKLKEELNQLIVELAKANLNVDDVTGDVVRNKKGGYGDFTSTVAFSLNKELKMKPIDVATKMLGDDRVFNGATIEVIAPGFINIYLEENWKFKILEKMQREDVDNIFKLFNISKVKEQLELNYNFLKDEISYIAYRTNWVLSVFEQEGIYPEVSKIRLAHIKDPFEEALIDQLIDWLELQEEETDEGEMVQLLEKIVEIFHKYHNTLSLRKLDETQRNVVLSLFKIINKMMSCFSL
ncbi:hypothetical protein [Alkaliphilus transvaalensis]|uniref:hypothetical protein n=1 Tax=Alkaliphilus transvaalensis TaxID=114628 RepID=UPI00047C02A1|nr:hypothetical protein [Alkaliphilus transvaalensis]